MAKPVEGSEAMANADISPLVVHRFAQRGGAWSLGSSFKKCLCTTWPGARLDVSASSLSLHILWREYAFPRAAIQRLCRYKGFFSIGIRIQHSVSEYPELIVYWPLSLRRYARLMENLLCLGYYVVE
jgi:hypothetical protein